MIIFNEGTIGAPDRNGLINGTVGGYGITIPTIEATYAAGKFLVDRPNATVATVDADREQGPRDGQRDRGDDHGPHRPHGHLRRPPGLRPRGPGHQRRRLGHRRRRSSSPSRWPSSSVKPTNQVRFIWFSGEEQGLFGSTYYADQLTKTQRANTAAMLDFDMLASPNFAYQIYDGDGSEFGVSGPNGSGIVESVFQKFYDARGLYTERIAFDGRSDYDEFTKVGIPAGGIAAGAEVHKTPFQKSKWGGIVSDGLAGQFDPCYHLACDSLRDQRAPGQHQRRRRWTSTPTPSAHSVLTFAMTTSSTNGTDKANSNATKSASYELKGSHRRR